MMAKICPIDVSRDFKISEHPGHEGSKKERSKCLKGLKGEREGKINEGSKIEWGFSTIWNILLKSRNEQRRGKQNKDKKGSGFGLDCVRSGQFDHLHVTQRGASTGG